MSGRTYTLSDVLRATATLGAEEQATVIGRLTGGPTAPVTTPTGEEVYGVSTLVRVEHRRLGVFTATVRRTWFGWMPRYYDVPPRRWYEVTVSDPSDVTRAGDRLTVPGAFVVAAVEGEQ